jgi:hypothetical protein
MATLVLWISRKDPRELGQRLIPGHPAGSWTSQLAASRADALCRLIAHHSFIVASDRGLPSVNHSDLYGSSSPLSPIRQPTAKPAKRTTIRAARSRPHRRAHPWQRLQPSGLCFASGSPCRLAAEWPQRHPQDQSGIPFARCSSINTRQIPEVSQTRSRPSLLLDAPIV